MAGGGLYDPLGTDRPTRASRAGPSLSVIALFGVLIGFASLFAAAAFRDDGERGEPRVVAKIGPVSQADPATLPSASPASPTSATLPSSLTGGSTASPDQEVEIQNGVRVIRLRRDGATAGSLVMKVPAPTTATAAAPLPDTRLLEPGSSGPLPKVGIDGRGPAEAYAGAAAPEATGKPWVAIVVEPLGSDPAAPALPGWPVPVTLGFGVDGADLPRQVGGARAAGHEVVLMLPPQKGGALDAAASSTKASSTLPARDRLHWQLSRFTGYAGVVVDTMSQDRASVAADVLEMTRRGLYVVDDALEKATVPAPLGQAAPSPMTNADLMLSGAAESEGLERFGERLAALARVNGSAIGIVPASSPVSAAMSRWIITLADKGVALVPLSAVVSLRRNAQERPVSVAAP